MLLSYELMSAYEIVLRRMPPNTFVDKSTVGQVMAWCRQWATSINKVLFWQHEIYQSQTKCVNVSCRSTPCFLTNYYRKENKVEHSVFWINILRNMSNAHGLCCITFALHMASETWHLFISRWTSNRKILRILEAAGFDLFYDIWNLTGFSAALLSMSLSNFKAIGGFTTRGFTRSYGKTSVCLVNRGPEKFFLEWLMFYFVSLRRGLHIPMIKYSGLRKIS